MTRSSGSLIQFAPGDSRAEVHWRGGAARDALLQTEAKRKRIYFAQDSPVRPMGAKRATAVAAEFRQRQTTPRLGIPQATTFEATMRKRNTRSTYVGVPFTLPAGHSNDSGL
jgi:hypothetical protein